MVNPPFVKKPTVNSRGKSGRVKTAIIKDLRGTIAHLKTKIKWYQEKVRQEKKIKNSRYTKTKLKEKVADVREDKNRIIYNERKKVDRRDANVQELRNQLAERKRCVRAKDRTIDELKHKIEKQKLTLNKVRGSKRRKKKVFIYKKLTKEQQRYKDIADKGIDTSTYNLYTNSFRLARFAEENKMSVSLLGIMLQLEIENSCTTKELRCGTRAILNKGVREGLLSVQPTGATKHYFLTVKGKEITDSLRKYIKRRKDFIWDKK